MRYLLLIALMAPITCRADHEADVHLAAHFGLSYAVDTFAYGFYTKAFRMDKTNAKVFSIVTTLMVGALYKATEQSVSGPDFMRSMGQNALGCGAAMFTQWAFEF